MPTSEIDKWVNANRSVLSASAEHLVRALDMASTFDEGTVSASVMGILDNIMAAGNEDEIFAAAQAGTTSGKDFVDIPFRCKADNIQWKKSAAVYREQGAFPFYMLADVFNLQTGERQPLSCGGPSVVVSFWKLQLTGAMDKYDAEGGMPLILTGKPAGAGIVLIPKKYIMPVTTPGPAAPATPAASDETPAF